LVIGTAGHIDHGKTSLIKALTGKDLDALDEEKRRGITIELGFAFLNENIAFVDVPGHEKLVKTMVAGASAMEAAMLVIAADDGIMPQTREHLVVLDAMGISEGVVVITKADLVDDEWIDLVVEEVHELIESTSLKNVEILVVDSINGRGINELRTHLEKLFETITEVEGLDFFRMPIDRSFLIKGYGRVVTGTVWSGILNKGSKVRLLPGGQSVRVRGVQKHEADTDYVSRGDRAALNVQLDSEPERGQVLIEDGRGVETDFLDGVITLLPDARLITHRMRIRLHLGTSETIGRLLIVNGDVIQPGEKGYVRIALENKVVAMTGDLGVIRLYSPMETLGGVKILDPEPPDMRRTVKNLQSRLEGMNGDISSVILSYVTSRIFINRKKLVQYLNITVSTLSEILSSLEKDGKFILINGRNELAVDATWWNKWLSDITKIVKAYHKSNPDERGIPRQVLIENLLGKKANSEIFEGLIARLEATSDIASDDGCYKLPDFNVALKSGDKADAELILDLLRKAGINSPIPSVIAEETGLPLERVRALIKSLKQTGAVIILSEKVILDKETFELSINKIRQEFGSDGFVLTQVNELLNTTRKYGVPLLEYLDNGRITIREGDTRKFMNEESTI